MDVTSAHMDNVSFHSKTRVQKWKYVVQIRFKAKKGAWRRNHDDCY